MSGIPSAYKTQVLAPISAFRSLFHAHLRYYYLAPASATYKPATMSGRGKGKTAKKSVSQSSKAGLQFPVGRVAR